MLRLLLFSALFSFPLFRLSAQPGALDPSFNAVGIVTADIQLGDDYAQAVAVQPDGKVVMAGYAAIGSHDKFVVLRFRPDGLPDSSFGGTGRIITSFGSGDDRAMALAIQPDGKIVVGGFAEIASEFDFAVARYQANGQLDNTFHATGKTTTNAGGLFDKAYALALQPDGKILLGGTLGRNNNSDCAVVRYLPNGLPDPGFNATGVAFLSLASGYDEARGLALQADGKIVLAGFADNGNDNDFALARFTETGAPDPGFGDNGKVITPIGTAQDYAHGVALAADGKILVAGYTASSPNKYDFALARYLPDGTPDTSLNGSGKITAAVGDTYDECLALTLQPDGKALAAGYSYTDDGNTFAPDFALLRFRADGQPDSSFGQYGRVVTPIGGGSDQALAVALAPDGKILAAGRTNNGVDLDIAGARYLNDLNLSTMSPSPGISGLMLAPNPVSETALLRYVLEKEEVLSAMLYNQRGERVQAFFQGEKKMPGQHSTTVRFQKSLPSGIYTLVLHGKDSARGLQVLLRH